MTFTTGEEHHLTSSPGSCTKLIRMAPSNSCSRHVGWTQTREEISEGCQCDIAAGIDQYLSQIIKYQWTICRLQPTDSQHNGWKFLTCFEDRCTWWWTGSTIDCHGNGPSGTQVEHTEWRTDCMVVLADNLICNAICFSLCTYGCEWPRKQVRRLPFSSALYLNDTSQNMVWLKAVPKIRSRKSTIQAYQPIITLASQIHLSTSNQSTHSQTE